MTDEFAPKVADAPGLVWRKRARGWVAQWEARLDLRTRGFKPKSVIIWKGVVPNDLDKQFISDQCQRLQSAMLVWGRGGLPEGRFFDGTFSSLIYCYQTDPDSTYRKLRYKTKETYNSNCARILKDHGDELIRDIKARQILRWHEEWAKSGVSIAHSLIGLLRTTLGFGATFIEDAECARLRGILRSMRFENSKPRTERMTAAQAIAIRAKAHEMGRPSIALGQSFQYELALRQLDVIGEWVPIDDPMFSEVTHEGFKWIRGLRWPEIDGNRILRHTTSKRQKDIEVDLKLAPMVLEELDLLLGTNTNGPVIVDEYTRRPYKAERFRELWRKIANAAGIPKEVMNMDSRAGAITEATDAGAELEHVRHMATHSDIAMTQRYSRGSVEKVANVQHLRVAHRNRK